MAKAPNAEQPNVTLMAPVGVVLDRNDKFLRLEDNSDVELVEGRDFEVYVDEAAEVTPDPSARGDEDADTNTTTQAPSANATPSSDGKCVDCKGSGLQTPSTLCPTCDGSGQEKIA